MKVRQKGVNKPPVEQWEGNAEKRCSKTTFQVVRSKRSFCEQGPGKQSLSVPVVKCEQRVFFGTVRQTYRGYQSSDYFTDIVVSVS